MGRPYDFDFEIPGPVRATGEKIAEKGGELYVVGGWVRDQLRGVECHDIDLATSLPPAVVKEAVSSLGKTYDLGEKFGTVGVRIGEYTLEVTTFRSEEYSPGSRHPSVTPLEDIEEDLARRDFTVNAMAVSIAPDPLQFLDPFDGAGDIERRLIRTPGPPGPRMAEDPLRMMRAVRFAAQLDYEIEEQLLVTLEKERALLDTISWERRKEELERILVSDRPDRGIRILVDTGLMEYVSPEVAAMKGVDQPTAYHRADVLEHTLLMMNCLPKDSLLRRAALFHDLGKPSTKVTEPKISFPDHEKVGTELAGEAMKRLRYSREDIQKTTFLVRRHMRPIRYESAWSDAAVRRLVRDCVLRRDDEVIVPLQSVFDMARADIKAGNLEKSQGFLSRTAELEKRIEEIRGFEEVESMKSPLDGHELMELFGRSSGPWLREVKEHLTDLVIDGELDPDDRTEAVRRARAFLEENG